jgi:hypothetical protein
MLLTLWITILRSASEFLTNVLKRDTALLRDY